jgi:hypothetical protein
LGKDCARKRNNGGLVRDLSSSSENEIAAVGLHPLAVHEAENGCTLRFEQTWRKRFFATTARISSLLKIGRGSQK